MLMYEDFVFDLRNARKISGLTQADCGHLISASPHQISDIERGIRDPSLREIHAFSILYGRNFESLHGPLMRDLRRAILQKTESLPAAPETWPEGQRRTQTLERLIARLLVETQSEYGT